MAGNTKTKRFVKKQGKQGRKALKGTNKGLYRAVKNIAKNEALKALETKYVTDFGQVNMLDSNPIESVLQSRLGSVLAAPNMSRFQVAMPSVDAGWSSNKIIGRELDCQYITTKFTMAFPNSADQAQDIIVKLFCLENRRIRNALDYNAVFDLDNGGLLRLGAGSAGSTSNWDQAIGSPFILDKLPVNRLTYKVHHVKSFRFTKNRGLINGTSDDSSSVATNSNGNTLHEFTWTHGQNKKLKFDENANASATDLKFPTNYCPFYGVVAYYADGGKTGTSPIQFPVTVSVLNTMYYKDA